MSIEDSLGLNGYSFEPDYNEQELETLEETVPYEESPLEEWCDCGHCCEMGKPEETVCCKNSDLCIPNLEDYGCITDHDNFDDIVLNPIILEVAFIQIMMYMGHCGRAPDQLNNKQSRLTAYRQCVCWMLRGKKLGKGKRVIFPSCVVDAVGRKFPEPSGDYTGVKSALESITDLFALTHGRMTIVVQDEHVNEIGLMD